MNEDLFGSLAAGRGPYGGKRGKSRMDEMTKNIVAEWEEDQQKKKAETKAKELEEHYSGYESKEIANEESKTENSKSGDSNAGKRPEFREETEKKSLKDGLKKLIGR